MNLNSRYLFTPLNATKHLVGANGYAVDDIYDLYNKELHPYVLSTIYPYSFSFKKLDVGRKFFYLTDPLYNENCGACSECQHKTLDGKCEIYNEKIPEDKNCDVLQSVAEEWLKNNPKIIYRPYKDGDEFYAECINKFGSMSNAWVYSNDSPGLKCAIMAYGGDRVLVANKFISYEDLLANYKFINGDACGVY